MWACLMTHLRREKEFLFQKERRIQAKRLFRYHHISKVYYKKSVQYGNYIEVYEYDKVKVTFKKRNTYNLIPDREKKERRVDSIGRARTNIYRIVEANVGRYGDFEPVFLTLTFRENIKELSVANAEFRLFIKRLNYRARSKLKYLCVPEFQKRGAVHFHMVLFNMPFIDKHEIEDIWGLGMTNIQGVKKIKSMGAYLAKYLSKSTIDKRLRGQKAYFTSRKIYRPIETYGSFEVDNILSRATIKKSHIISRKDSIHTKYEVTTR